MSRHTICTLIPYTTLFRSNRSDNMMVGFMRNGRKPFRFVRLLAKTCAYNDNDLVYFSPRNVDIENKTVKGQVLIKNKWMTKEVPDRKSTRLNSSNVSISYA